MIQEDFKTFDIFENRTYKQNSNVLYSITAETKTSKITLQKTSKQKFKILISVVLRKIQFECCFVASQRIINREKHIHILLKIKFSTSADVKFKTMESHTIILCMRPEI